MERGFSVELFNGKANYEESIALIARMHAGIVAVSHCQQTSRLVIL